jgi:AraC-like DNA-binding protein
MRYREIKPKPPLSQFIECFWTLEGQAAAEGGADPILPDGCAEMVLNFSERFRRQDETGRQDLQPSRLLVGQITEPMRVAPTGRVEVIGIRFNPGGTRPFFRFPIQELTNRYSSLDDFDRGLDREVETRLGEVPELDGKLRALESLLARRVDDGRDPDPRVSGAVDRILSRNGLVSVDDLARDADLSARQFERVFSREVGVGPKLLCRILRFQQVFRAADFSAGNWAAVAADCGYYDQSHLIRDFQQFAASTPAALVNQPGRLTEFFIRRNRPSLFSNTALLGPY